MRRVGLILFNTVWVMLLVTACGDDERNDPPPNVAVTVQVPPEGTVVPGCAADVLESWYEIAGTLITSFRDESAEAVALPPAQLTTRFERLQSLRDTIAQSPTPECALDVHSRILTLMRDMLTDFQQYINGDMTQEQVTAAINEANAEIDGEISALLATTASSLEERLRSGEASAGAAPDAANETTATPAE